MSTVKGVFYNWDIIYNSENLVVKRLDDTISIFHHNYIIIFSTEKEMCAVFDYYGKGTEPMIIFKNNKMSEIDFYLDIKDYIVFSSSEEKIINSFEKVKSLMVFS